MLMIHEAGITYLVDAGRVGYLKDGIPEGGPLDDMSAELAYALLGTRAPHTPWWLEIGPAAFSLIAENPCTVAVAGAPRAVYLNRECVNQVESVEVHLHQDMVGVALVLSLEAGDTLTLSAAVRGVVTYITCDAELREAIVLGSRGYCPFGDFPGLAGRRVRAGDHINLEVSSPTGIRTRVRTRLNASAASVWLAYPRQQTLRFSPVGEFVTLRDELSLDAFGPFHVQQADRRALRLLAPETMRAHAVARKTSSPTVRGLVQWPASGSPILLGPDRQTVGGYARFGVIRRADQYKVGRLWPGCGVTFEYGDVEGEIAAFERARRAWMRRVKNHIIE